MPRPRSRRFALTALALIVPVGCIPLPTRVVKPHSSTALLDSGPTSRVSGRQAADVQIAIGRSHEDEGRFDQAESAYRAALAKDPNRADAEASLAILADRKGDSENMALHFDRALKLDPKDPNILCDRGYSLYLRRRFAESETSLRSAIAADPSHARSHNNLGLVLAARGDKDAALAEFTRAGCDISDARTNLALILAMEGKLSESREQYSLAVVAKPGSRAAAEGLRVAAAAVEHKLPAKGDSPAQALASALKDPGPDPALRRTSLTVGP